MSGGDRPAAQSPLVRAATLVWLALGVVLIALALRDTWRSASTSSAATARAPAAPPSTRPSLPGGSADSVDAGDAAAYVPEYELRSGEEVVLVFIGASFCGAQRAPGFPAIVERAKRDLARRARAGGRQFRAHAVALDWDPAEAMAFIRHFGAFDEISVGSNWLNDGAVRYIWRDLPSEPAVPQIVVLVREVEAGGAVRIRGERVARRLLGTEQISRWVDAGAPI